MRGRTALKVVLVLVVATVIAAVAIVMSIDPNQYKDIVIAEVKDATGRELVIEGDLEMALGFTPAVQVEGVRLANAPWGSEPTMISVERFEAQVALLPALTGTLQIQRLILKEPVIVLETDAAGRANWDFTDSAGGEPEPPTAGSGVGAEDQGIALPTLEEVRIENGKLVVKEGGRAVTTLALHTLSLTAEELDAPLHVALAGTYNTVPFDAQGVVGPLTQLTTTAGTPYPVAVQGTVGGVEVSAEGTVAKPATLDGVDLVATVKADDLAGVEPLVGTLPRLPAFAARAAVKGGGTAWRFADLDLSVGKSAFTGTVALDLGGPRPAVEADLQAALVDLGPFVAGEQTAGSTPNGSGTATTMPHDRVFSRDPLPINGFKAVDAVFAVSVARLVLPDGVAVDGLGVEGRLKNGRLILDPLEARLGDGTVRATVDADASSGKALALKADIRVDKVVLGRLFAQMGEGDLVAGAPAEGTASLSATGSSVAGLMGGLDGTVRLSVGEGRIHEAVIDWAGADVISQLLDQMNPLAEARDYADLVCAAVNVRARDGVVRWDRQIALETSKMTVVSSGAVDLGAEKLDIAVRPAPKSGLGLSAGKLAELVRLQGTLANPQVGADAIGVARTAASVVGALATGGVSLLAEGLVDRATVDPHPCATALGTAEAPQQPANGTARTAPTTSEPQDSDSMTPGQALDNLGNDLQKGLGKLFGR